MSWSKNRNLKFPNNKLTVWLIWFFQGAWMAAEVDRLIARHTVNGFSKDLAGKVHIVSEWRTTYREVYARIKSKSNHCLTNELHLLKFEDYLLTCKLTNMVTCQTASKSWVCRFYRREILSLLHWGNFGHLNLENKTEKLFKAIVNKMCITVVLYFIFLILFTR